MYAYDVCIYSVYKVDYRGAAAPKNPRNVSEHTKKCVMMLQKNPRLFPFFVYWTAVNQVRADEKKNIFLLKGGGEDCNFLFSKNI